MGRLMDIGEVAGRLNVSVETLRTWRKRRTGPPSFLIVGSLRYDEDELSAWIKSERAESLAGETAALSG